MIRPRTHGSALLLVVILLGVLAAIGAAAVSLSSRDRINASAKSHRDLMTACASAAQLKVWAELARYGPKWFGSDARTTEFSLPDGTRLAPLHYGQTTATLVKDVVVSFKDPVADEMVRDLTNRSQPLLAQGAAQRCVARCTVPGGMFQPDRVLEVEFMLRVITK